jgi:hypothetical protein
MGGTIRGANIHIIDSDDTGALLSINTGPAF